MTPAKAPVYQHYHSPECRLIPFGTRMGDLNVIEQGYILSCPHKSHDAVRQLYKGSVNV